MRSNSKERVAKATRPRITKSHVGECAERHSPPEMIKVVVMFTRKLIARSADFAKQNNFRV